MSNNVPDYAELHCLSNFTFMRGASHPEELVERAAALGYKALAVTDECSFAGAARAHLAARSLGLKVIYGTEVTLRDGLKLILLAKNREGYGNLSALVTLGRSRAEKGCYELQRGDFEALKPANSLPDCLVLWIPGKKLSPADGKWLAERFSERLWIAFERHGLPDDLLRLAELRELGGQLNVPLVATGDVHMHLKRRRPLQDLLTALRFNTTVFKAGQHIFPNGERVLRSRVRLASLYPSDLLEQSVVIASQCQFELGQLRYEYPDEVVPSGFSPASYLREITEKGLCRRYPEHVPEKVRDAVEYELALISELKYEAFFLTVFDIVRFARQAGILCQGRGSAANSSVCYALGITEVNPAQSELLFERFLSRERREPPDIDVDFEHDRREEVIQYIYSRYGRDRAALAASLITYRTRGALRDVGRALGFGTAQIDALARSLAWWDRREELPERLRGVGLNPDSPRVKKWIDLAEELRGFPRHLSQHVGGFVISQGPLARLVPIENAAMKDRSVIQWDKDDLDAMGLIKVDVLALGMLSAIRRTLEGVSQCRGQVFRMEDIPQDDPATYRLIQRADTIGIFQIESRAQMAMLPRLRPETYYDLVIEVAIVRPGPIQGNMVHPYLKRRADRRKGVAVTYPKPELKPVLERTLGVPIFQEQAMKLAMVAAGFTAGEADELRRAMAAWKRKGGIEPFREKLIGGMLARGYEKEFAEALFRQLEGFGDYGFPESHAASFALLVYVSAWLKTHYPAAFLCGLLNSQPMGFYLPAQLVQDAQRRGVEVRPVDVRYSAWDNLLEFDDSRERAQPEPAVRLGFRQVSGLGQTAADRIVAARETGRPFVSVDDLALRAGLESRSLQLLAHADALQAFSVHRRDAAWQASAVRVQGDLFEGIAPVEGGATLEMPSEGQSLVADYAAVGLTLGRHPLMLLRDRLESRRFISSGTLRECDDRALARVAGIVTCRQRPGTASGIVFITMEDEDGAVNVVVYTDLVEKHRKEVLSSRLLGVYGQVQREGSVVHLVAKRLVDLTPWLGDLATESRDFH